MIVISTPLVDGMNFNGHPGHFQQMPNQLYLGMKDRGLDVVFVSYKEAPPPLDPQKDFAVADWTNYEHLGLPKSRIVLFDNYNFNYMNQKGIYSKYGFSASIPRCSDFKPEMKGFRAVVVMSNDVALGKLATEHPDIKSSYDWWRSIYGDRIKAIPHPINKPIWNQYFNPDVCGPKGPRVLVYHRGGKNSQEYISLLRRMGYCEGRDFVITDGIDKGRPDVLKNLNQQYHAVMNGSLSESGPINMIEYQMQGLLVVGTEDWWTGYGEPRTVWTYDPNRQEEMANNIRWLLNPNNAEEIKQTRNRIHAEQMARTDNEWSYCIDQLLAVMQD